MAGHIMLVGCALLASRDVGNAADYDLSLDFSGSNNPNGVWSFGWTETLDGPFALLGFHKDILSDNGVAISDWQVSDAEPPGVAKVVGDGVAVSAGGAFNGPSGTVYFTPGTEGTSRNFGVIRFTVPAGESGTYQIATAVQTVFDGPLSGDSDFHVVRNGEELFGEFLPPNTPTSYANNGINLVAGDTIDFVIGRGADGSQAGTALKIQAVVKRVSSGPLEVGLVTNGSFELGVDPGVSADVPGPDSTTIEGWMVENASVDYIGTRWIAGDGGRCLDLSGTDAATISQIVTGLSPGQGYRLSFLMAANPEVGNFTARLRTEIAGASQEFSFEQTGFSTSDLGWAAKSMDFVATASTHKLSFVSLNPGWAGAALDKVTIEVNTNPPTPGTIDILIANHSFEDPVLADGQYNVNDTPGWVGEGTWYHVANPGDDWFTGTSESNAGSNPIDGKNIAGINNATRLYQDLSVVFLPNHTYKLAVLVGTRKYVPFGMPKARLASGETLAAEGSPSAPSEGEFAPFMIEFTTPASGGVVGMPIRIEFQGFGGDAQWWLDDVRLTAVGVTNGTNVPPPSPLVANGSFELGSEPGISADVPGPDSTTIEGWMVENASVDYIGTRWIAGDGARCLDLSGTDAATISQMITGLTPGEHYRLSFLMAANPEVGMFVARLRAEIAGASQEFSFEQTGFTTDDLGWAAKSMDFVATASTHKLSFVSLNPGWAGAALDKISISSMTHVPPPVVVAHNLSSDFSGSNNPNGVWSFGWTETLDGPFALLGFHKDILSDNGVAISDWQVSDAEPPGVAKVVGDGVAVSAGGAFNGPSGTVYFTPGTEGTSRNFGVIRFTVPAGESGTYQIATAVQTVFDGPLSGDSDFHVVRNGEELFGEFLPPNTPTSYANNGINLVAGDTIDFVIGRGADGSQAGTALKIQAVVKRVSSGPLEVGLVTNGSFELGVDPGVSADVPGPDSTTIEGWMVENASVDYIGTRWIAGDGARCLDLSGTDAATISQMITGLTPGEHYRLSFLMAANPEVGMFVARLRAEIAGASQEFSFEQTGFSTSDLGWAAKSMDFVATASTHKLSFVSLNPGWAGAALDKVTIEVNTNPPTPGTIDILIANHSFENPVLPDGQYNINDTPGWIGEGSWFHVANPGDDWFTGTSDNSFGASPIDGSNIGGMNNETRLYQDLEAVLLPNHQYTLSLLMGTRKNVPFGAPTVRLIAGGVVVAETSPVAPEEGTFESYSLTYQSPLSGAGVGGSIRIEVQGSGADAQVWIDDVRLTATPIGTSVIDVAIANRSFENPVLPDGQYNINDTPGWIGEGSWFHVANPADDWFTGTSDNSFGASPIDGSNIGGMNNETRLYQDLEAVLLPNHQYTLSLLMGTRKNVPFGAPTVRLIAGGVVVAETSPVAPEEGTFESYSLTYQSPLSGAGVGGSIRIEVQGSGADAQVWIDDVRLTATPIGTSVIDVAIANRSFENPVLPDGQYNINDTPGWIGEGSWFHVANPADDWFTGTSDNSFGASPIDGSNIGGMNNETRLYQDLEAVLLPNHQYTLSLLMGTRKNVPFGAPTVRLIAGGVVVAETSPVAPEEGTFESYSLTYQSPLSGAGVGGSIRIEVQGSGADAQVWIDDVRLIARTGSGVTNPPPVNHTPLAKALVEPAFSVWQDQTNILVIAVDGIAADVLLDGSLSSDPEGDALDYFWTKDDEGTPFAAGVVTTNSLAVGTHSVTLLVSDGTASDIETVSVEVLRLEDSVAELYGVLVESEIVHNDKRPLLATLDRVSDSFAAGRLVAGVKQLRAFQQKTLAQVARRYPETAARLLKTSQQIIEAIELYLEQHDDPAQAHGHSGGSTK